MAQDHPEDRATVSDYDAIVRTCQLYIDGGMKGEAETLRRAFHPEARVFGSLGGQRLDVSGDKFIEIACASPVGRGARYRGRVLMVHQTGDTAVAAVAEDGCWGGVSFLDYLSLVRVGSEWKIASKVFAHTGGRPPA